LTVVNFAAVVLYFSCALFVTNELGPANLGHLICFCVSFS